ncbi:MAG TPA: hypothetical protein VHL09_14350, partial [Dehalococcoidia bacterium]|nr:hypothetical protein [Dehalococcoidia bacterium]
MSFLHRLTLGLLLSRFIHRTLPASRPALVVLILIALLLPAGPLPDSRTAAAVPQNDRFGFVFVNGVGYNIPDARYRQAVEAGAGWTRWPFYWPDIEKSNGQFDYSAHDAVVNRDRQHGLQINGILLNNPGWTRGASAAEVGVQPRIGDRPGVGAPASGLRAQSVTVPGNLYQPVFDGNGNINQSNYWARFVYNTVSRYKGQVKVWEMWNEPDWTGWFWTGSPAEYYQLLKVGYLAAKHADPSVTVLHGGLCHWCANNMGFFDNVAREMAADPSARHNNFYFDALPMHFYVNPYYAQRFAKQHRATLARLGTSKPLWINETNVTVCGDPERLPDMTQIDCPSGWRGTLEEQSNYMIQIYALAAALHIDRTLIFQFYDDGIRSDAYGIVRNNGRPRPAYTAIQTAAKYLNGYTAANLVSGGDYDLVITTGGSEGRVSVAWNKTDRHRTAVVPATTGSALLVTKYGQATPISAQGGSYLVSLAPATYSDWQTGERYIGGDPVFIVESTCAGPRAGANLPPAPQTETPISVSWGVTSGDPAGSARVSVDGISLGSSTVPVAQAVGYGVLMPLIVRNN